MQYALMGADTNVYNACIDIILDIDIILQQ